MVNALLLLEPAVLAGLCGLLGICAGSFLNVVIHRLPIMIEQEFRHECACLDLGEDDEEPARAHYNLCAPASACPKCQHQIRAWENIPVISWLLLRGRCSGCNTRISARYPAVELLTGLLSAGLALHFGAGLQLLAALGISWALIALFWIDLDTYLLPDAITLPLLWAGLLANALFSPFVSPVQAILGASIGYLSLWSVYWLFKLLLKKEGMGYGDFKLMAALGAWFGVAAIPELLLISSVTGSIIGITLIATRRQQASKPIAFGPYIALAGLAVLLTHPHSLLSQLF